MPLQRHHITVIASQIPRNATIHQLVRTNIKKDLNIPHYWPLWGNPLTNGQKFRKYVDFMVQKFMDFIYIYIQWKLLSVTKGDWNFDVSISAPQITKFMGQTWGPPGSWRPKMGPMLTPWTLLSGPFSLSDVSISAIVHVLWHIQRSAAIIAAYVLTSVVSSHLEIQISFTHQWR